MDLHDAVGLAVSLLRTSPELDDDRIVDALVADGVDRSAADQIAVLLPLAFFRLKFQTCGAALSDHYLIVDESGRVEREVRLSDDPVYNAALASGETELARSGAQGVYTAIVARSAEFRAINNALNDGASLENLEVGPTMVVRPAGGGASGKKPWWRWWSGSRR